MPWHAPYASREVCHACHSENSVWLPELEKCRKTILYNQRLIIIRLGLSPPNATLSAACTEVSFLNPNYRPKNSYVIITEYDRQQMFAPDTAGRSAHHTSTGSCSAARFPEPSTDLCSIIKADLIAALHKYVWEINQHVTVTSSISVKMYFGL